MSSEMMHDPLDHQDMMLRDQFFSSKKVFIDILDVGIDIALSEICSLMWTGAMRQQL